MRPARLIFLILLLAAALASGWYFLYTDPDSSLPVVPSPPRGYASHGLSKEEDTALIEALQNAGRKVAEEPAQEDEEGEDEDAPDEDEQAEEEPSRNVDQLEESIVREELSKILPQDRAASILADPEALAQLREIVRTSRRSSPK